VIIAVNMDAEARAARTFLAENPANFKIINDADGQLAREYEVIAMPSSYVIGRDGEMAARHLGFKVKQQDDYESILLESLRIGME
jgi:peroxiredoxin